MIAPLSLLVVSLALVHANPIVLEPVNPVVPVVDAIKSIESPVPAIPLANSVQAVPSSVVPSEPVVPKVQPVEQVVPAVQEPVVPSQYAPKEVPAVVVPVEEVPIANVDSSVVAVPAAPVAPISPVAPVAPVVPAAPVVPVPAAVAPVAPVVAPVAAAPVPIDAVPVEAKPIPSAPVDAVADKNSADPSPIISGSINSATKLVIDLDEHLKKYLPAEDEIATTLAPHIYSGDVAESEAERQNNQMTALIDQVNQLAGSIENTITDLVARRRYVTAAMLRSMLNYVRRVRVNLERLQNRLQSVQAVATSGQNSPASSGSGGSAVPGAAFLNTIRDRINRMTEEIGALVTRIRGSFTPGGSTVVTSPLPPLVTAANLENIGAAAAAGSIVSAINTVNSQPQSAAAAAATAVAAAVVATQ